MAIPPNKVLERLIDYSALKHKVISQNISNSETIGYKRKEVEFKQLLNEGMQSISGTKKSEFKIVEDENLENLSGTNNVDVNKEMADLAENQIMFKFAAKKLNAYYRNLQNVIKGGK